MTEHPAPLQFITADSIRIRAHSLWEQAGSPPNRDEEFWIEAESQLLREWAETLAASE